MADEKKYSIYTVSAFWNQPDLDYVNSTGFSVMYKADPGINGARQEAMKWWEDYLMKPRRDNKPSLEEIGADLIRLQCTFFEMETWCLSWFSHYTFNIHLSDYELLKSFSAFVSRKINHNYCLMGAEDTWRWKGPCHCEHCVKAETTRIDH